MSIVGCNNRFWIEGLWLKLGFGGLMVLRFWVGENFGLVFV